MRIALEPTFNKYGVDIVFTGCVLQSSCPLPVVTGCCVRTGLSWLSEQVMDQFFAGSSLLEASTLARCDEHHEILSSASCIAGSWELCS